MRQITAVILAGGASRRMGRDKAELLWHGDTLLARTARVAREAGLPVIVVGRQRPDDWPHPGVEFASDALPGQGPLGGLVTGLGTSRGPVLALACDMPLLNAEALRWLAAQELGLHGVAVRNGDQWEPLFSVYLPAALDPARQRLAAGRRSLHGLIEAGEFSAAQAPPEVAAALVNVNTPEDLALL